jgi:hypothetical protein
MTMTPELERLWAAELGRVANREAGRFRWPPPPPQPWWRRGLAGVASRVRARL